MFDTDSLKAQKSREKMINLFADRGDLVVSYHDHFPGLGYIRRNDDGLPEWIPVGINNLQGDTEDVCT